MFKPLKVNKTIKTWQVKEMDKQNLLKRNFDNPILKDTLAVQYGGQRTSRTLIDSKLGF